MAPAFSFGDFERQFASATVDGLTGPDKFRLWLILAVLPCEARTHQMADLLAYGLTRETVRRAAVST